MIKIVVECLVGFSEGDNVIYHIFGGGVFDQDACDKVRDSFHFCFVHAESG